MYDFRKNAADAGLTSALKALEPISQEWVDMRKRLKAARVQLGKAAKQYSKGSKERDAVESLEAELTHYERGDLDDTMMRVIGPKVSETLKKLA